MLFLNCCNFCFEISNILIRCFYLNYLKCIAKCNKVNANENQGHLMAFYYLPFPFNLWHYYCFVFNIQLLRNTFFQCDIKRVIWIEYYVNALISAHCFWSKHCYFLTLFILHKCLGLPLRVICQQYFQEDTTGLNLHSYLITILFGRNSIFKTQNEKNKFNVETKKEEQIIFVKLAFC